MKAILSILLVTFFVYSSAEELTLVRRELPKTCEDVLAQDLCVKLREISAALRLQVSKVDDAIKDALINGLVSGPEIYRAAREFLKNEVLDKTCEDFLAPGVCTKLRKIAAALKIKAEKVEEAVRETIASGVVKATDIYLKVVEFLKKEVLSKTCEDFLAPRVCTKLRSIAAALKVKIEKLNEFVVDAVIAAYDRKDEIYQNVISFLKDEVLSKTCEDVLATDVCAKLKSIASKLRVRAAKVDEAVKNAILKGYTRATEIIADVKDFFKNEVLTKKCEDFISASTCSTLKSLAAKLKVRIELVDKAVKEAIVDGYEQLRDIYDYCVDYVKSKIQCEDFLGSTSCSAIRRAAKAFGVKLQEVEDFLRNLIAAGKAINHSKFNFPEGFGFHGPSSVNADFGFGFRIHKEYPKAGKPWGK
eukprot:gene4963-5609_t